MSEETDSLSLLNVFEIDEEFGTRHLICFLDPVLAGSVGIHSRWVVGEFTPDAAGEFDAETFELNEEFIQGFIEYMNTKAIGEPELIEQAKADPGMWLYLVDPRFSGDLADGEPPAEELIGRFAVDDAGGIVADSFQYNAHHILFSTDTGVSGMLSDRKFYDWLHPVDGHHEGCGDGCGHDHG